MNHARPVGISILAMFCALLGLLGMCASASYLLVGWLKGSLDGWAQPAVLMIAVYGLYFPLARGLWRLRAWSRWFAPALLLMLTGTAVLNIMQDALLDLVAALMFLLAGGANMAVIAWLRLPGTRELFRDEVL